MRVDIGLLASQQALVHGGLDIDLLTYEQALVHSGLDIDLLTYEQVLVQTRQFLLRLKLYNWPSFSC